MSHDSELLDAAVHFLKAPSQRPLKDRLAFLIKKKNLSREQLRAALEKANIKENETEEMLEEAFKEKEKEEAPENSEKSEKSEDTNVKLFLSDGAGVPDDGRHDDIRSGVIVHRREGSSGRADSNERGAHGIEAGRGEERDGKEDAAEPRAAKQGVDARGEYADHAIEHSPREHEHSEAKPCSVAVAVGGATAAASAAMVNGVFRSSSSSRSRRGQ
ncbi:hypothetical protein RFI_09780 [Reticulomyxa filosa]|uniref:Uncharacterized protein n=1 Tax=Reticulomyxa filosa TaxID=46433 RepID=X6NN39_RETFI|nr:hypothetical protein RFI_09780 [Reticulomyxa filosa]|eukprot:ETO27353.1 hypothetical protein RFI_09780 [Reticulomyxa filosa]